MRIAEGSQPKEMPQRIALGARHDAEVLRRPSSGRLRMTEQQRWCSFLRFWLRLGEPIGGEVAPAGICRLDECHFLGSNPAFDLLFAGNCAARSAIHFIKDQTRQVVLPGEAVERFVFVLGNTPLEIICDSDIEHPRCVRKDIDEIAFVRRHWKAARFYCSSVILRLSDEDSRRISTEKAATVDCFGCQT